MQKNLECPADFVTVNENQVRITAGFVLLSAIGYLITRELLILFLLSADFILRALNFGKYSLFNFFSRLIVRQFKIGFIPIDQAPKRFAAQIGAVLSVLVILSHLSHSTTLVLMLAGVLVIFSFLESVFGFCAGCHVYTFYKRVRERFVTARASS